MNMEQFKKATPIVESIKQEEKVLQEIRGNKSIVIGDFKLHDFQYSGFEKVREALCFMIQNKIDRLTKELGEV